MNEFVFEQLEMGYSESISVAITQSKVEEFMHLSGDRSTVHVDDDYAGSRGFEQRLVHGVLVVSYISQLIGMALPGKHGVLRTLSCEFRKPCYSPNLLVLTGRVDRLVPAFRLVGLAIEVRDIAGAVIVTAKAETVMKL
jgi:3-hydroxybutyryl-CoA dehydratase